MADIVNLQFNADTSQLDAAQQKLQQVKDSTNTAAASAAAYGVTLDSTTQAYLKANAAAINNAAGLNSVADANDKASAEAEKFLQKLSDQADKASMTTKEYLELQAAMHDVSGQAAPYISAIDQASKSHDNFSLATSGARRELVVLGHEMLNGNWTRFGSSLMVLGERAGGLSAVFSLAGGAVAVAAAAIGLFIVAAVKGSEEISAFNKAIQLTNDSAGVTSGQLDSMAQKIGAAGAGTSEAAKALTELVSSGAIGGSALESVGTAAVQMAQVSGESIDTIVKKFTSMASDVTKGALEMNNQYHNLTAAQYDQIKAMQESGDVSGAMKVEADSLTSSLSSQQEVLGTLPSILKSCANAWHSFWNSAMNLGKPDSASSRVSDLKSQIAEIQKQLDSGSFTAAGGGGKVGANLLINQLKQQLSIAQSDLIQENRGAERAGQNTQATTAGVNASANIDKMNTAFDKQAQKLKEVTQLKKDYNALWNDPSDPSHSNARLRGVSRDSNGDFSGGEYSTIMSGIDKRYDQKTPKAKNTSNSDSQGAIELIKEQIKSLQNTEKQAEEDAKISMDNGLSNRKQYYDTLYGLRNAELEKEKPLIEQEIAASGGLTSLAAREKYKARIAEIDDQIALNKKKNQQDDAKVDAEEAKSLDTVIAAYEKKRAALMASQDKSVDTSNMSKTEKAFYSDNLSATTAHTDARNNVLSAGAKSTGLSGDDLVNEPKVKAALEKVDQDFQNSLNRNRQVNQERIASDNDWLGGLMNGMTDVAGKNATMYDTMKSYGQTVTQDLTTAFTNFVTTGKMSFRSLILDMIQQLEKLMIQKGITMLLSFMGGSAGAGAAVGGNAYGFTMPTAQAQGGAWSQGVQMFAQGGVVTNPTSFGTSTGSGLMGEAGPEAIMPLKRASDGSLGVTVSGMSSSSSSTTGGDTYNVTVNVQGGNNPQQTGSVVSEAVLKQMQAISRNEIAKANRPGGQNNSLVLGNTK